MMPNEKISVEGSNGAIVYVQFVKIDPKTVQIVAPYQGWLAEKSDDEILNIFQAANEVEKILEEKGFKVLK